MSSAIRFGVVPGQNTFAQRRRLRPLLDHLGTACGRSVILENAQSYEAVLEGMLADCYDLVLVGPELFTRARRKGAPFTALVQPVRNGQIYYHSTVITRNDSGLDSVQDLVGRSIAYVDRNSSSGYLFPRAMLKLEGLKDESFSKVGFSGTHDRVVKDVLKGIYDAGVCYENAEQDVLKTGTYISVELQEIARTVPIPNEPIAMAERFRNRNSNTAETLDRTFLRMHENAEGRQALERLGFDRFKSADNSSFDRLLKYLEQ